MLYTGHGIDLVGTVPSKAQGAPRLYRSTDGVHWTDVTPPVAEKRGQFSFQRFAAATFINGQVGYVSSCDQPDSEAYLYETTDAGTTWSTVPFGGCFHGIDNVQLVTTSFAVVSGECHGIPCAPVITSTDGFRTHSAPLTFGDPNGPPPPPTVSPLPPVNFITPQEGFTSSLISDEAADDGWHPFPLFAATHDGGRSWQQSNPPTASPQSIYYGLPTFDNPTDGVVPTLSGPAGSAALTFDTTTDGGETWHVERTLPTTIDPTDGHQAEIDLLTAQTWWVASPGTDGHPRFDVTTDAGAHWTTSNPTTFPGPPSQLNVVNGTVAFALALAPVRVDTPSGVLLRTVNAAQTWQKVNLP